VSSVTFPFEYHAEVLGEHMERRAALRSIDGAVVAALVLGFLVLQSALRSWRLAFASLLGVPIVMLGSMVAVLLNGGVITLGAILGCVLVLLLAMRIGIATVRALQAVEQGGEVTAGQEIVQRGMRAQFPATLAALLTTAAIAAPFAAAGNIAGLEILHPMASAALGGLIGSAVVTLMLVPAVYIRFGAGTASDTLGLGPEPA